MDKIDKLINKRLDYLVNLSLKRIERKQYSNLPSILERINKLWQLSVKRFWRRKILG